MSLVVEPLKGTLTSHNGGPDFQALLCPQFLLLIIQTHLGRWQRTHQMGSSLWETQTEFLVPSFGLTQPQCWERN